MTTEKINNGDYVINPKMPEWGEGQVIETNGDKAIVLFNGQPNIPRKILSSILVKTGAQKHVVQEQLFRNIFRYSYKTSEKRAFMSGILVDELVSTYPDIYDDDDIRLAKGPQGKKQGKHFCEWYGAKLLFGKTGCLSLVEKAEIPGHKRKAQILTKLMPLPLIDFIYERDKPLFGNSQCPDLLLYNADYTDWFFCEVKGPGDDVSKDQEKYFIELKRRCGKPIDLLILKEVIG